MNHFVKKDGKHFIESKGAAVTRDDLYTLLKNMGVIVDLDKLKTSDPRRQNDFNRLDARISATEALFQELIRTDNFWTYFLKMWNERLLYNTSGEVFTSENGEVYWIGG